MAISKRRRFEILRRDGFTCRYCGRSAPDVVLQIDHVTPRALGGSDHPSNLAAACEDCNQGKAAVPRTAVTLALLLSISAPIGRVGAFEGCDPFQTPPDYDGSVPTAATVLGFDLGAQQVTSAESDAYLAAVDGASDRVVSAQAATSVGGRPIRYAIVGSPDRVTPAGLATIRANLQILRDPLAQGIADYAARELCQLAICLLPLMDVTPPIGVALTGGLLTNDIPLRRSVVARLGEENGLQPIEKPVDAVVGALRLAAGQ
jgi:hypothetical protein